MARVVDSALAVEGGGFVVRRPFVQLDTEVTDPFLLLDEMGPVVYKPGEAIGAPDHPHRGFETVTYMLDGGFQHRDSTGGGGVIRAGDTQWMTAGAGLVHSELPIEEIMRDGGRVHGLQLWVNLPRTDKLTPPQYQLITADEVTEFDTDDGRAHVKLIAGDIGDHHGPGATHTPITYAHATLQPRAQLALPWPREFNALVYVLDGNGVVGPDRTPIAAGQLAVYGDGDSITVAAGEDEPLVVVLLGGRPIREPIAWYGPFVMNTKAEIIQAIDDFESGALGSIPPLASTS
ncbi:MAG TPA: pirin family protein [Acidimicrobiia bacterium]|nr:pirin family protein [Acidimicrobiia bacterium]